ncbi:MAG: hypothetical protein U0746_10930 [Gemmataceae bacterium]
MLRRLRWIAPATLACFVGIAPAQTPGPNEKVAIPRVNVQDKEDVWALQLTFKGPRVIETEVPGLGRKKVVYLWYQIVNTSDKPHTYIPEFEIVTLDRNTSHMDQVMPAVQAEIAKLEDPTGFLNIKNSVTISAKPVPPSKPGANPIPVTGVAIWPDVAEKAGDTTRFSIFVSGLSNGWDDKDGKLRRKTLQLNYRRLADAAHQDSEAIKFESQAWVYRATSVPPVQIKPIAPEGR